MLKIEKPEVVGWEAAIRGMRNPLNSWDRSDSGVKCPYKKDNCCGECQQNFCIGPNDKKLMSTLRNAGTDHRKFMRMITVYLDIASPLYWWKEFDTYKVGTVANSCSTMHKIHEKEFTLDDFSHEHLIFDENIPTRIYSSNEMMDATIENLNILRNLFVETKDKKYWWQMIQLLPSSYNQKRTVMLNYEVLAGIYPMRKNHRLDEWRDFCKWIEQLPYSEIIIGTKEEIL